MTWVLISIPLMFVAVAIATVPVIVAMISEQQIRTRRAHLAIRKGDELESVANLAPFD